MRIATWNINSIRIREAALKGFIGAHQPDVLCLQETKVQDEEFPRDLVARLGFEHLLFTGEKSYNGVAILSKLPLKARKNFDVLGNNSKRHIAAELPGNILLHNFYVPAGGDIPDIRVNPKFEEKLRFVDWMAEWAAQEIKAKHKVIALGDLNIAPLEQDVWSHKQLLDVVSHTPIEVEKFERAQRAGNWIDTLREFIPAEQKLYSWWSYRNRDWKVSNRGRRLDHIWITPALKLQLKSGLIYRDARDFEKGSDHVPVMVELAS